MSNLVCRESVVVLFPQERRNHILQNCSPALFYMFLVKACLRDVVQGCSNVWNISPGISVHKSQIKKTLRTEWKAFVATHAQHGLFQTPCNSYLEQSTSIKTSTQSVSIVMDENHHYTIGWFNSHSVFPLLF